MVPFDNAASTLSQSLLSPGSRQLLLGLLRTGSIRVFPGGGTGIEYGSLLKTAVRPDDLGGHVREAAAHLAAQKVDLLLIPGMSGYPVGSMYALAANVPALLLKKKSWEAGGPAGEYPPGSFVIPSYTGDRDVVMSADFDAVRDMIDAIATSQLTAQANHDVLHVTIRCAGADDIIDKAVMAIAITECTPVLCQYALDEAVARYRARTAEARPITTNIEVVAWVTPLIKSYNRPEARLRDRFGIEPFAGIAVTSVHLDPCAIGVDGAGLFAFARASSDSGQRP